MKTAIYKEGAGLQIILTPETAFEKEAFNHFGCTADNNSDVLIFSGGFYECRGGWTRQAAYNMDIEDRSLIIKIPDE